uniref:G_PROTEIN_RECEP_F1_2 domain-containing protein n=1 Tax=Caenorhabditis tropicalis TaxID=1561998 RepID=A0A1I7V260_9PELO
MDSHNAMDINIDDVNLPINYIEVIAMGAFAFCDPVAIVICLPVFQKRFMCQKKKQSKLDNLPKTVETAVA